MLPENANAPQAIRISYDPVRLSGRFERDEPGMSSIWERLQARAVESASDADVGDLRIELPWPVVLGVLRDFGTRSQQQSLGFRFEPDNAAKEQIAKFSEELRRTRAAQGTLRLVLDRTQIRERLQKRGWDFQKRDLREFQLRDLERLASMPHGANFSVPGAGKTTVTFALCLLVDQPGQHILVVAPKAAFPAWRQIVEECIAPDAPGGNTEGFTILDGREADTDRLLRSGSSRFVISYDLMVRQASTLLAYLARQPVHLILDEAHRMKAGTASQRGAFLLRSATLPVRRDILTGTPMPQSPSDLVSQLSFLHPGQGLDLQIQRGVAPRQVLGDLYVRTTKSELGLPPARRHFHQVGMAPGQLALYSIVRSETLRQLTQAIQRRQGIDFIGARRSVMRLLQLSANPVLALTAIASNTAGLSSGVAEAVVEEGASLKMKAVAAHARTLASDGRRSVIWTIFTDTIHELERMLADLNPVSLYGAIPSGDFSDFTTREGRINRFHNDPRCLVMIANPAAASEGISLHTVCHDAIYLDRSYVSTHYLQSLDRIHRLGLLPGTDTNIHIYQTKAPAGLGSIDNSVSRRLATKLRALQQLLNDQDLHEIALDEENADDPVDFDVELQDLVDLVEELEGRGGDAEDEDGT